MAIYFARSLKSYSGTKTIFLFVKKLGQGRRGYYTVRIVVKLTEQAKYASSGFSQLCESQTNLNILAFLKSSLVTDKNDTLSN